MKFEQRESRSVSNGYLDTATTQGKTQQIGWPRTRQARAKNAPSARCRQGRGRFSETPSTPSGSGNGKHLPKAVTCEKLIAPYRSGAERTYWHSYARAIIGDPPMPGSSASATMISACAAHKKQLPMCW
ncbi:uncharacterized protein N7529_012037 [Penicillium soppii]|uniref:uncharacterized protein n=1 Tax=Penicillium soppii TaxID=69789 RepID=UPI002546A3A5|nr:uncharacterized protein N7529_012037 [Penicillium soppii]KAJ5852652.1 hypothetical protein N7529_012037 [Penicillium soppii]